MKKIVLPLLLIQSISLVAAEADQRQENEILEDQYLQEALVRQGLDIAGELATRVRDNTINRRLEVPDYDATDDLIAEFNSLNRMQQVRFLETVDNQINNVTYTTRETRTQRPPTQDDYSVDKNEAIKSSDEALAITQRLIRKVKNNSENALLAGQVYKIISAVRAEIELLDDETKQLVLDKLSDGISMEQTLRRDPEYNIRGSIRILLEESE